MRRLQPDSVFDKFDNLIAKSMPSWLSTFQGFQSAPLDIALLPAKIHIYIYIICARVKVFGWLHHVLIHCKQQLIAIVILTAASDIVV